MEDILAKWKTHKRCHPNTAIDSEDGRTQQAEVTEWVKCSTCPTGTRVSARHMLWNFSGYRDTGISATKIEPKTLLFLCEFAREATPFLH